MTANPGAPDWTRRIDSPTDPIGTVKMAHGATVGTASITVPTNATGITITAVPADTGAGGTVSVKVVGNTTTAVLDDVTGTSGEGVELAYGPNVTAEASVTITVTWSAVSVGPNGFTAAYIAAVYGSGIQAVVTPRNKPLITRLKLSALVNVDLANGITSLIVPNSASEVITVYGWDMSYGFQTTTDTGFFAGWLEDETAVVQFAAALSRVATAAGQEGVSVSNSFPGGIELPLGKGIQAHALTSSANKVGIFGTVYYTQG